MLCKLRKRIHTHSLGIDNVFLLPWTNSMEANAKISVLQTTKNVTFPLEELLH
jgi:hypothetical protein